MVINILSNRSEWTFYFLSSVQFNFTISEIINLINQIKVIPEFFFYREMLTFYEELITYHFDKKQEHIRKCKLILESCEWGGMQVYGEEMKKFFDEYKDQ